MKQVHGGDIYRNEILYDFSVNTNPYGPPEGILKAIQDSVVDISKYPDVFCEQLINKIAVKEGINSNQILCTNGAAEFFFAFCQALKPQKALLQAPAFAEYENALKTIDCKIEFYESKKNPGFQLQKDFIEKLQEDLDVVFLCTPNNPTGVCISDGLLEQIIKKCQEQKIYLVLDICFLDFVGLGEQEKWINKMQKNPYLILVKAFTKLYSIPGIRLGYGMSSNISLLEKIKSMLQPWNVSSLAQTAGIAALKEEDYVTESLKKIKEQKDLLEVQLKNLGLEYFPTQTNYILFKAPDDFYENCLKYQLLIRDCSNYRGLEKGYYRIAVRKKEENEILISIFQKILKGDKTWQKQL